MLSFKSVLSVASRRRFGPMSSWLDPRVGWRLLKDLKKHNRLYPLKTENPPLSLALNPYFHYSLCPIKDPKIDQG
jgi:hypothetical protein